MNRMVPPWALVSAAAAPVLLIGGWTVAARLQPPGYDPMVRTISALAGYGATNRLVMTAALAGAGVAYLVTAYGLRPATLAGRFVIALGGLATLGVAATPFPRVGYSPWHAVAATVAFGALAVWPAVAWRRGGGPWALRPTVALPAAGVLLLLVGGFAVAVMQGMSVGLAERITAGAQALWPLVVVAAARYSAAGAERSGVTAGDPAPWGEVPNRTWWRGEHRR